MSERRRSLARSARAGSRRMRSSRGSTWFNSGFERLVARYRATIVTGDRPQMAVRSAIYALVCLALVIAVLPAADRLPADRGPGRRAGPVQPSARRDPEPHAGGAATRSSTISCSTRAKNVETLFTVAGGGGGGGASGQNTGQGFVNLVDWEQAQGQGKHRRRHRPARVERVPRPARRAGVRARARRDPRPRPVERLHHGAAEPQRPEPRRNSRPRATGCSTLPMPIPQLTGVRISDLPDVADSEGRRRPAEADARSASTRTT